MLSTLTRLVTRKPPLLVRRIAARSLATQAFQNASAGATSNQNGHWFEAAVAIGLGFATAGTVTLMDARKPRYPQPKAMVPDDTPTSVPKAPRVNTPPPRPDLPVFSREEVAEHCDEDSLWYTFRGGVYDLTPFYQGHPGGAPVSVFILHTGTCCYRLPRSHKSFSFLISIKNTSVFSWQQAKVSVLI
jgi:hypothetical protein